MFEDVKELQVAIAGLLVTACLLSHPGLCKAIIGFLAAVIDKTILAVQSVILILFTIIAFLATIGILQVTLIVVASIGFVVFVALAALAALSLILIFLCIIANFGSGHFPHQATHRLPEKSLPNDYYNSLVISESPRVEFMSLDSRKYKQSKLQKFHEKHMHLPLGTYAPVEVKKTRDQSDKISK
ncbi:hypothetical protein BU16DRAFT_565456 [Lophium mytilinum]|uniref:Uncharacterized protein n=1 Tax=Lophium mytilinum TaxID=390894 RepID=A0A6A6QI39_9PEZI|nr:hypothetical protein BU16DRAFT_565456 [Lophium mytilinum]